MQKTVFLVTYHDMTTNEFNPEVVVFKKQDRAEAWASTKLNKLAKASGKRTYIDQPEGMYKLYNVKNNRIMGVCLIEEVPYNPD